MAERREDMAHQSHAAFPDLTKDDSMVIKGVAILAMMWHHCFLKGRFEKYGLVLFPLGVGSVINIAGFLKICVSLFAFVSGYGLYCTLRNTEKQDLDLGTWYLTRYVKTFSDYWLIVLLLTGAGQLINGGATAVYVQGSAFSGLVNFLLDLLGVAAFFGSPQFLGTWWYMSAALVYIILAPFLYLFIRRFGAAPLVLLTFIVPRACSDFLGTHYLSFLMAFVIGMAFADQKPLRRLRMWVQSTQGGKSREALVIAILFVLLILCYKFDRRMPTPLFWDIKWGLSTAVYALFIALTLARIPLIRDLLMFLGRWSSHIYLIHTFFRVKYASAFVYGQGGHFVFVVIRLLAVSLLASALFRLLKYVLHYDDHVQKLLKRVTE